ncbi:hypothetical protein IVB46_25880 [Bradyrhizobium sp. 61]|uniref:hypothetical protein n=1 Tax=Bradyrhizobium sp. 61 TaxID=2782679 RepID=UPI001FFA4FEC|nr:hypothetical protein [Bradyrhizobium sp. 61]MCK1278659.1 hypothetical protein [Bradyrhizobium sp. 61]
MTIINKSRPRNKSPRSKGAPRATQATSSRLKELWATPEFRERMKQRDQMRIKSAKRDPTKFSRYGVPDGMRRAEATLAWAQANEHADRFIAALKQNGQIPEESFTVVAKAGSNFLIPTTDDGLAEVALREAFVLAVGPSTPQVKTQAINTVLTYTKAKPASRAKLLLGEVTDFLDEISERQ